MSEGVNETIVIRPATADDAVALSRLAAATFRETFAADNTAEDMAQYLAGAFSPDHQAAEIADPGSVMLVAEQADAGGQVHLVAYAYLPVSAVPAVVQGPAAMELKRFYVSRPWHGRRVAHALMEAVLETVRARGVKTLWLGVWERNPRAMAFYAKYGFTRAGEHTFVLGRDAQTDWILTRTIE